MSDDVQSESGDDRNEADYYEKGNDIARRGRTEKPRLKVLRDELPEFTNDELHRLYDNIEKAIRDEVVEALREKNEPEPVTDGGEPKMKSIECPNCGMPYTVPEEADHWSCDCGASWELDPRTDGGVDQSEADVDRPDASDYIPERDLACEAKDAVGWMHIGADPSRDPVGDYWVPVDDPELVERDHVPQDEVKQFPLEAREPEYGSGEPAPDHVHNWTFTEVDETEGEQRFEFCNILVDWEDGMSTENIDERKCVNEAVGKYRYKTHGGLVMEDWLCETHRDEFEDAIIEEVETA